MLKNALTMKNTFIALALSFVIAAPRVFALAGDLPQPSLAFPENSPLRNPVMAVLSAKEFRYLGGKFINAASTLRYGGDAKALQIFLERLAKIKGVTLEVVFRDQLADADWRVTHSASEEPQTIVVTVNSATIAESSVTAPKAKK
jgi:hypothetical protein